MLTNYTRIGETARWETLPNGLPVCIVPKKDFQRKYALFATRYGGMDMKFQLDGQWLDTPAGIAHYLEHKMFDTAEGNAVSMAEGKFHDYDPYRFPEIYDSISADDVLDFIRENLVEERCAVSIIEPLGEAKE